jgi:ABC-type cobalt transport system substrate-binding protein
VVSGLIGALIATLFSALFSGSTAQSVQMALAEMQVTDPQVERMMESLAEPESIILISFLFNIVLYPLFGAIGGAIGGMIFGRSRSEPAV